MTGPASAVRERELQVLRLIAEGNTSTAIGRQLGIPLDTVKSRLRRLYTKLGARDRAHAVHLGHQLGLLGRHAESHGDHAGYTRHVRAGEDPKACPLGCWDGERAYRNQQRHRTTSN